MLPLSPNDHAALAVDAWKKVVQTQEHFNEICMKVRTLYATVIGAIISFYGVFLRDKSPNVEIGFVQFDQIIPISFAVFVVSVLFYFVDRHWYHRLLVGAVNQGIEIERLWASVLPEIAMGSKITDSSAIDMSTRPKAVWLLSWFVSDSRLTSQMQLRSDAKIEIFYKPIIYASVVVLACALLFGGLTFKGASIFSLSYDLLSRLGHGF